MWTKDDVIFSYTRQQAIRDGALVDVTGMAKEAGFRVPTALTQAAHAACVELPDGAADQDEAGRLWDVLFMLAFSIRANRRENGSVIRYRVCVRNGGEPSLVELKAVCGPDDDGRPCLTIMLPEED